MLKEELASFTTVETWSKLRQIGLAITRFAWPVVATCYLVIAVVSVIQTVRNYMRYPCGYGVVRCVNIENWLESTGLSAAFVAVVCAVTIALPAIIFIGLGFLLWWKARDSRVGLVFSYILVTMWMSDITNVSVAAMWNMFWRRDESLPFVPYLAFYFGNTLFMLAMISVVSFPLLFPNGHAVPHWTRWLIIAWTVVTLLRGLLPSNSLGTYDNWPPLFNALVTIGVPITSVVSLCYRYQMAADDQQRRQIRWIVPSTIAVGITFIFYELLVSPMQPKELFEDTLPYFFLQTVCNITLALTSSLLGLSITMAVLQRRLFDITIIVNRALVFGSLTIVVVALYISVVTGVNVLLSTSNPLFGSVIATAFIAVFFQPLYQRLQHAVNKLIYGERDNPYAVIIHMSRQLETAVAPDDALKQIVNTVGHSLRLSYVSIRLDGNENVAVTFGEPTLNAVCIPLIHQNERVGELTLSPRSSEIAFSKSELGALTELARTAGVAAYAVRKAIELQTSRERLVTSREEERRRLQRDLHDGLGPALASIILGLDKACRLAFARQGQIVNDPEVATLLTLLNELKSQTQTTMQDVRDLVHALRPPVLNELGLIQAIYEHANRIDSKLKISVQAPDALPELSAAAEIATYRIVQEALNNVLQHAQATHCQIYLSLETSLYPYWSNWVITVQDNGVGLPNTYRAGVGLASLRERAEELGGSCQITRLAEGGTRITARLPLPS